MFRQALIVFLVLLSAVSFAQSDTNLIKMHLLNITKTKGYRHFMNTELLNKTADYILNDLAKYADTVFFQEFQVNGLTYKNVICRFGDKNDRTVVIGAHYDVCGMQEGADDNATERS
jgi:acetylornithine deacetylase/succinyl-diaminopimelate desuccinylase-like protein